MFAVMFCCVISFLLIFIVFSDVLFVLFSCEEISCCTTKTVLTSEVFLDAMLLSKIPFYAVSNCKRKSSCCPHILIMSLSLRIRSGNALIPVHLLTCFSCKTLWTLTHQRPAPSLWVDLLFAVRFQSVPQACICSLSCLPPTEMDLWSVREAEGNWFTVSERNFYKYTLRLTCAPPIWEQSHNSHYK